MILGANGGDGALGGEAAEQGDGQLGADAGDGDQAFKESFFIAIEKSEEGDRVWMCRAVSWPRLGRAVKVGTEMVTS